MKQILDAFQIILISMTIIVSKKMFSLSNISDAGAVKMLLQSWRKNKV